MTDDPLLGKQLGNFRLERILGRGGMGQVYYGWDVKLQRPVAIKVIDFRFRHNAAYAKRFVLEAQAAASWHHENIAQIYHADEQDNLYYFAMEHIDGSDLGQLLSDYAARGEFMPQADVLRIGRALASALDYAHAKNVVHRDVKPSNVIVSREGRVVLTDFGLALDIQQGSVGEVFGSAHYIAPEQARRSSNAIPQSDLYSLGIILYEMLTGLVPFDDPSPTAVALQHITQPPPAPRSLNPNLNAETEAVLLKALSKAPQDRYQTGHDLIMALENALQIGQVAAALPPLPPPPAGMRPRSGPADLQTTANEVITSPVASHPHANHHLQRKSTGSRRKSVSRIAIGGCILILIVAVASASLLFAGPLSNLYKADAPIIETPTSVTLASPIPSAEVQIESALPTSVSTTSAVTQATSPLPEVTTPAPPITAGPPTVKYPAGKRILLLYDDNSLYFLNLSESNIPINWVAFERLSDSNLPLNRFNGSRWGQYYSTSKPGWCMALEILDSPPYLDPPECGHDDLYLSLRTPTRDDATVFWTAQEGSHQFRALWREGGVDEEVARCEIGAKVCEVFLP